jgi:integrase
LVECGATVGWRLQEFLTLKVHQVDLEHRMLRLEPGTTKNKEGRNAPMSEPMFRLLGACCFNKGGDEFVFTRPDGSVVRDMRKAWFRARKRAGLPNLLFHDLRRTAARNLRRHGIAESTIKSIGGWKTTSVFHRYTITDDRDMTDAMRQFEESKARMARNHQDAGERKTEEDTGPLM